MNSQRLVAHQRRHGGSPKELERTKRGGIVDMSNSVLLSTANDLPIAIHECTTHRCILGGRLVKSAVDIAPPSWRTLVENFSVISAHGNLEAFYTSEETCCIVFRRIHTECLARA